MRNTDDWPWFAKEEKPTHDFEPVHHGANIAVFFISVFFIAFCLLKLAL